MSILQLTAEKRTEIGKQVKRLRSAGKIPAVVYGHGVEAASLSVPAIQFQKIWQEAGESTLVDLVIGDASPVKVIINDVQHEPVSGNVTHIDFHQVKMTERIEITVVLNFVNEAPAVKELGGTLVKDRAELDVECLPGDLVKEIDVDLSSLKTFEDVIRVENLTIPKGLEVQQPPEDQIAHVEAPRSEAELAELDSAVEEDVTKVEQVEKPAKESDEAEAAPEDSKE